MEAAGWIQWSTEDGDVVADHRRLSHHVQQDPLADPARGWIPVARHPEVRSDGSLDLPAVGKERIQEDLEQHSVRDLLCAPLQLRSEVRSESALQAPVGEDGVVGRIAPFSLFPFSQQMSHRRGRAQRPVAMPPTAPRSRGGPSSAPSRFFRPPPSQSDPFDFILEECGRSSAPSRFFRPPPPPPPPPSRSDPFDFILEECGRLSLSQEAHLRNAAPFLRQEKLNPANLPRDERGLGYHILYRVFGFENPHHHRSRRPPYTDAEAAELALSDYFLALGPRRVHLLQTPPKEGKQARGTRRPSGTRAAAPEGMPPPAEVPPSRRLGAAAATPAAPAEGGKDKLAGMKRARDDFSKPPRSLSHHSHAAGERSSMGKKTCANPDPVNPPAGRSSPGAGVTSTGDGGGRRRRNLPPSILCPDDWEDARTTGYERGSTRLRPVPPPPQVDQRAKGKAPAAGAAPCPSSSLNARTSSSADAAGVTEPGPEKGGASGRPSSSSTATVPVAPPPSARREATSPSAVGSGGDSLSAFIEALVRFSNRPKPPNQTQEKADPLEALAKGAFSMPAPKWWRPGGYGGRSTPPDK